MNSDNQINQKRNYDQYNQGHRGGGNRGRGGRGGGFNRGRGGRGGRGGGRGGSKMQNKSNNKFQQFGSGNNNYQVMSIQNNLPDKIDLKNPALVEYIGEIFFKESFLQDPWKKNEESHKINPQAEFEGIEAAEGVEGVEGEGFEGEEQVGEEQGIYE